jgi:regulator of protease activity HflC (stomatin/prohibitin superfamily)
MGGLVIVILIVLFVIAPSIRVIREWERGILLRLGRLDHIKEPGIRFVWPVIDKIIMIDTRVITMDVPKQEIITRDNVSVMVDAVVFFQVVDAGKAITKVENWRNATGLRSQTALRSVIGQADMDDLLAERDKINNHVQLIIDEATEPWGIKVTAVEVRDVVLPESMKRVMANQAETERERRAKVINAEGELQASEKLAQAAEILSVNPQALQLRFLQTLTEVGAEHNSTIVFPVPIDLLTAFMKAADSMKKE